MVDSIRPRPHALIWVNSMDDATEAREVRFGRTRIHAATGETIDQNVQAIVYPANSRGVMGTGRVSAVQSSAGPDVEREVMQQAPLRIGTAIVTSSGQLADRGIEAIVHAVVTERLGDPISPVNLRRAIAEALRLADDRRYRCVALPLIGVTADDEPGQREAAIETLVDEIVAYVRRSVSRIEQITLTTRFVDDLPLVLQTLYSAREQRWTSQR
jgi:O-acetyl-ADP-ribose deacetylase